MASLNHTLAVTTTVTVATQSVRPWLLDNRGGVYLGLRQQSAWWVSAYTRVGDTLPFWVPGTYTHFSDAVYLGI